MREIYRMFYRAKGVRYAANLARPSRFQLTVLPKDSVFHYHRFEDGGAFDITAEDPLFADYTKKILYKHIINYVNPEGSFRRPPGTITIASAPWRRAHSKQWMAADKPWYVAESMDQLVVVNYGYLDSFNKYMPVQLAKLWRWRNTMRTIFSTMNTIAKESQRNQFFIVKIPKEIQGKAILDRFTARPDNVTSLNLFALNDDDGMMQLEFWRWLNPAERNRSLLGVIDEKHFGRINIIFEGQSGQQVLVNLAYLNSWIKGNENKTEMNSVSQFPFEIVQKLYLKMLMTINEFSAEQIESVGAAELQEAEKEEASAPVAVTRPGLPGAADTTNTDSVETDGYFTPDEDDDEKTDEPVSFSKAIKTTTPDESAKMLTYKEIEQAEKSIETKKTSDYAKELFDEIDKDIEVLDKLSLTRIKNRGILDNEESVVEKQAIPEVEVMPTAAEITAAVYTAFTPTEQLQRKLAEKAESNNISASDFRKMSESVKKYASSLDPYGSQQPLSKAMAISPEELSLGVEKMSLGDNENVADKTMTSSSLLNFDKQYIKHIMKKDVLNAVDALQNTGVVVRAHEIEINTTALGTYEHHRIELKPIDGMPSTVNFTLPVVDKDGTFTAGGNKYILRKQRVD